MSATGNKYLRKINSATDKPELILADVYEVLEAFSVTCPARQHAIKKLLCAGIRGQKDELLDLQESRTSLDRAIEMQKRRQRIKP